MIFSLFKLILLTLIASIAALTWQIYQPLGVVRQMHQLQENVKTMQRDLSLLRARNDEIQLSLLRLKIDPVAIEVLARQELNMIKPQESFYRIIDIDIDVSNNNLLAENFP